MVAVIFYGPKEAGKTTLAKVLGGEKVSNEYAPSKVIEYFSIKNLVDIYVIPGQEEFRKATSNILKGIVEEYLTFLVIPFEENENLENLLKKVQSFYSDLLNAFGRVDYIILAKSDLVSEDFGKKAVIEVSKRYKAKSVFSVSSIKEKERVKRLFYKLFGLEKDIAELISTL